MNIDKRNDEFIECVKFLGPFSTIINLMINHNMIGYIFIVIGTLMFIRNLQAIRSS